MDRRINRVGLFGNRGLCAHELGHVRVHVVCVCAQNPQGPEGGLSYYTALVYTEYTSKVIVC